MTEKTDYSSFVESPNSSIFYDNQPDEDAVPHLFQRITRPEAVISKLLNSLEAINIECLLYNISTRMPTLENIVHDRVQLIEKQQNCVKLAIPPTQKEKQKRKTSVFHDPKQRDVPSMSKSIEKQLLMK